MLERFCLEHLFDILNINEKLEIMNALLKDYKEVKEDFKTELKKVTEKFIITVGDDKGFVCADYKKKWQKKGAVSSSNFYIFILDKTKNQWVSSQGKKSLGGMLGEMLAEVSH